MKQKLEAAASIPIIDIFAGPGGLGEGFSALKAKAGNDAFRIALSVEKDEIACRTLRLRAIKRFLERFGQLDPYFSLLQGRISRTEFDSIPIVQQAAKEASVEVMNAELGKTAPSEFDRRIRSALKGADEWVLIGGPPCQAYSLAGRARRTNDVDFESDEKHFLYREYLRIIKEHAPPVFVMENVKGLLSSHHGGVPMFGRILEDLSNPRKGLKYEIRSLVRPDDQSPLSPEDYVIESEKYGVPQTRHRVILLGIRSDISDRRSLRLKKSESQESVEDAISDLPRIRSGLSRGADSKRAWLSTVKSASSLVKGWGVETEARVIAAMKAAARIAENLDSQGLPFTSTESSQIRKSTRLAVWLASPRLNGVIQHQSRQHMESDIARYLFSSVFAQEFGYSARLQQFPEALLPNHLNVQNSKMGEKIPFPDRFSVQCAKGPSSTIVSHISKDGHYYIHYDPGQCRSLTVREAARLQTFPDDYFFEGNRTQQYHQVGNAVPPLLANQIAYVVAELLAKPLLASRGNFTRSVENEDLSHAV
jgi:DNA (cytosine-5)-methyltransferase 1